MKVVYILSGAALYGGVKVVLQHALGLRRLGVDAQVVSPDPTPAWFATADRVYRQVDPLEPVAIGPADIAVGTIYSTVETATRVEGAIACHLCQGYEGLYEGGRELWPAIDAAYRLPTVKLAVSPHLVELIHDRFGQSAAWIPQPFRPDLFCPPTHERASDGLFRVLLSGAWDPPIKGVEWAMRALRPLTRESPELVLVRLSQNVPPAELELWPEAERYVSIAADSVPDVLGGVDALVGASDEVEGFGLPTLEAMGCARPCVLTDIGASRSLDPEAEASIRIAPGDEEALRVAVRRLRDDHALRRRLGAAGRRIAEQFSEERTARALLDVFEHTLETHRPPRHTLWRRFLGQ